MPKQTLAVKVDPAVVKRVRAFCQSHGIKYGFFVEQALLGELERKELEEDLLDLKQLRGQEKEAIPFEDYLRSRLV